MTRDEWLKFFRSVFEDVKPSILCIAGKEAFINDQSVSLLLDAVKLRNEVQQSGKQTEIGVITNGTLLHKYKNQLEETTPDYIDVSVDGLPEEHDYIRGEGAFEQLAPNLQWLTEKFCDRVWITHTVAATNLYSLPDFVQFLHDHYKVGNFSVGFYKPKSWTDQSLNLNTSDFYEIVDRVFERFEQIKLNSEVRVNMEVDPLQNELLSILTMKGLADPMKDIASVPKTFENGLTLRVNSVRIPVGLWRSVRVTPEGYWLSAEDLMQVKNYDQVAVAKLADCGFNARKLYELGLSKIHNSVNAVLEPAGLF